MPVFLAISLKASARPVVSSTLRMPWSVKPASTTNIPIGMLLYGHPHSRRKVYYKLAAWEGILAGCRGHTWARDRDCGFGGEDKCMAEFVKVAIMNEIAPGQARLVNIKGKEIALFNIEGTFFALENACTHEEGPLAEGEIEGHEVTCPWHGARFDVRTGQVLCAPAYEDAARYNVRVTGTDIEVEI